EEQRVAPVAEGERHDARRREDRVEDRDDVRDDDRAVGAAGGDGPRRRTLREAPSRLPLRQAKAIGHRATTIAAARAREATARARPSARSPSRAAAPPPSAAPRLRPAGVARGLLGRRELALDEREAGVPEA